MGLVAMLDVIRFQTFNFILVIFVSFFSLSFPVNKTLLIQVLSDSLLGKFEALRQSSKKTRSAGNDAESKSEGKYDTRSIEENYLADGFARQAQAAGEALAAFKSIPLRSFDRTTPIDVSALVQLEFPSEKVWFFLAPAAGGTEVRVEDIEVTVLSPESPLGSQLIGLKVGDQTRWPIAKILSVK
jgi:hypothetical protein